MAEQTQSSITVDAGRAEVAAVIADLEAYPEWTGAMKEVAVLTRHPDGRADQVHVVLDAGPVKDEYTLAYRWDDDVAVRWSLVKARMLKAMDGSYVLTDNGDGTTQVVYSLAVDLSIPMIGLLRRKAEKVIIDTALKELKKRVESQRG